MITIKEELIKNLIDRGASKKDAEEFHRILTTIYVTTEDINSLKREYDQGTPFEGGMSTAEALCSLCEVIIESYDVSDRINHLVFTEDYTGNMTNWFDTQTPKELIEAKELLTKIGYTFKEANERRIIINART